ncbi:Prohibitin [Tupaia chinensis]|uniref:Prohibitin n=1 Tax=Tupaia chinensis TaxID=246437 RepID=L9KNV6_TUPCH|nr:Prohibitin [Tupaia chinensis]
MPVITGSKDLQNVNIMLCNLFRPMASQLPRIFTSIGVHRSSGSQTGGSAASGEGQICSGKAQAAEEGHHHLYRGRLKATELITNSLATTGDGLIELRKLEATEDIAYQLSHSQNITYLPSGQSVLLQLPQ